MVKSKPVQVFDGGSAGARRFLRRREVTALTGLPRSSIYEAMARDDFPKPVQLGARMVGWVEAEILSWQRRRIAERDAR